MGNQASVPSDRSRKLEVIDMGFARTGTLSFSSALERLLDGPVMHGGTQMFNREDAYCKKLAQLYEYRRVGDHARLLKTLQQVIGGFVGCADCPMVHFLPELLELYPDVKVVLVTRDPDKWWASFAAFGDENIKSPAAMLFMKAFLSPLPGLRWFPNIAEGFDHDFLHTHGMKIPNRDFLEKHNDWVRRHVPKDRLIEMDLADGWEPLCKFLNRPIPNEPFPRLNDRKARDAFMTKMMIKAAAVWVGILSTSAVAGYGAWIFLRAR